MKKNWIRGLAVNNFIDESGMRFIADNAFRIEKSPQYAQLGKYVKTVEFVRSTESSLLFVEAKSSFPNPNNPAINPDKGNKTGSELFEEEVIGIYYKFIHSLNLYSAINIGVTEYKFPQGYEPFEKASLVFLLVINGFEKSWCRRIRAALTNKLRESVCISRIWKPEVYVINHDEAVKRKLSAAKCREAGKPGNGKVSRADIQPVEFVKPQQP